MAIFAFLKMGSYVLSPYRRIKLYLSFYRRSINYKKINLTQRAFDCLRQKNTRDPSPEKIKFIHVGKCGGTSIYNELKNKSISQFHLRRPKPELDMYYILWIRDPLARFVSAFNHSKQIVDFEVDTLQGKEPSLENCQAPLWIKLKINRGYAYEKDYEDLVNYFESANHLAESINCQNKIDSRNALKLMTYPLEHIYKGLGWYLDNGAFIDSFHDRFLFVGSLENMKLDFLSLRKKLSMKNDFLKVSHLRSNSCKYSKELSSNAKSNLYEFYKETDYKTLRKLVDYDLISRDTYDRYILNI